VTFSEHAATKGEYAMAQVNTQIDKVIYTAKAHTTGGREGGASRTSDGRLDVKLTVPGTKGDGTNPEQLSAVGWSSRYLSATNIVAA
jgi:lipoyl-dependent peroxiredoxin